MWPMNRVFGVDERLTEFWSQRKRLSELKWPSDVRQIMFWVFLGVSLLEVARLFYLIFRVSHISLLQNVLAGPVFSISVATILGIAAWTIWKADPSARGWSILASLTFTVVFLRQFVISVPPTFDHHLVPLFAGIVGAASFAWPD